MEITSSPCCFTSAHFTHNSVICIHQTAKLAALVCFTFFCQSAVFLPFGWQFDVLNENLGFVASVFRLCFLSAMRKVINWTVSSPRKQLRVVLFHPKLEIFGGGIAASSFPPSVPPPLQFTDCQQNPHGFKLHRDHLTPPSSCLNAPRTQFK